MKSKKINNKIEREKKQIKYLVYTALLMAIFLVLFKFLPMQIFGKAILFDASLHIATAVFILYFIWFFIDQDKSWRIPYFIFCFLVLAIVSFQRIIVNAHNDVGLLIGLVISLISIIIPKWRQFRNKFDF